MFVVSCGLSRDLVVDVVLVVEIVVVVVLPLRRDRIDSRCWKLKVLRTERLAVDVWSRRGCGKKPGHKQEVGPREDHEHSEQHHWTHGMVLNRNEDQSCFDYWRANISTAQA